MELFKKISFLTAVAITGIFILGITAQAAPTYTSSRSILPETNNSYWLGSTTPAKIWRGLASNEICLSGDCKTAWPNGSPGGNNTNIQFNDSGSFGGSDNLTWDGTILGVLGNQSISTNLGSTAGGGSLITTLTDDESPSVNGVSSFKAGAGELTTEPAYVGIGGIAGTSSTTANAIGVFGQAFGGLNTYAGYFLGNVLVSGLGGGGNRNVCTDNDGLLSGCSSSGDSLWEYAAPFTKLSSSTPVLLDDLLSFAKDGFSGISFNSADFSTTASMLYNSAVDSLFWLGAQIYRFDNNVEFYNTDSGTESRLTFDQVDAIPLFPGTYYLPRITGTSTLGAGFSTPGVINITEGYNLLGNGNPSIYFGTHPAISSISFETSTGQFSMNASGTARITGNGSLGGVNLTLSDALDVNTNATSTFDNAIYAPCFTTDNVSCLGATGSFVTDVTATSPLASTGGPTPNLSVITNGINYGYIQQVSPFRLLGNFTGSNADIQEVTTSSLAIAISDTTGTLATNRGGTGTSSNAISSMLYYNSGGAMAFSPISASGVLTANPSSVPTWVTGSAGTVLHGGTNPAFSAVSLTADVSGILPIANGGTATSNFLSSGVVYMGATNLTQDMAKFIYNGTKLIVGTNTNSANSATIHSENGLSMANPVIYLSAFPVMSASSTNGNTLLGYQANTANSMGQFSTGIRNTWIGAAAGQQATSTINSVGIGFQAGTGPSGSSSEGPTVQDSNMTFVGYNSSKTLTGVASTTSMANSGCIGANCKVGGTNMFAIGDANVSVGVGTSTPYGKLSVLNLTSNPSLIVEDETSPDATPFLIDQDGKVGVGTSTPNALMHIFSKVTTLTTLAAQAVTSQTAAILDIWNAAGATLFNVQPNGNVGIATSTPAAKFSMSLFNQGLTYPMLIASSSASGATSTLFAIEPLGGVGIGTSTPNSVGGDNISLSLYDTTDGPALKTFYSNDSLANDTGAGVWRTFAGTALNQIAAIVMSVEGTLEDAGAIRFFTKATSPGTLTEKFRISGNGNVGIGTTTPATKLDVYQSTLGSEAARISSAATNDDPTESYYQNATTTTDGTQKTLHTFTIPSSTTYPITCNVTGRRTGGVSGTAEDGAYYRISGTYKNAAGTATIIGSITTIATAESQGGFDATYTTSGATVLLRVTGAASNNMTWHSTCTVYPVSI